MNSMNIVRRYQYLYIILGITFILLLPYLYYTTYSIAKPIKEVWKMKGGEKSLSKIEGISRIIDARIEGDKILFKMTIYYNVTVFNIIINNWDQYTHIITSELSMFMTRSISIKNLDIKYNDITFSVIITFDVYNAISRYGNECAARFTWLLRPLDLDLIYNDFKGYNNRLVWFGELNGVYYEVSILLPMQGKPYSKWSHPAGFSYVNVWWPC